MTKPLGARAETALSVAVILAVLVVLFGTMVPDGNEYAYLIAPYKLFHPGFLKNDWTFAAAWNQDFLFNHLVGGLMLILPLEVVGWLGRLACWTLAIVGLLKLGGRFGIRPVAAALAILLWLAVRQSIVGGEWIFRDFEAKVVAYVLLLYALDGFLDGRDLLGAVLLGLTGAFHPSVGFAGAIGAGAGLLLAGRPWSRWLRIVGITALCALPGIIPGLVLVVGRGAGSPADWRFLTLVAMPEHMDAATFALRAYVLLCLLLLFSVGWSLKDRGDLTLRFILGFELGIAAVFAAGVIARYAGWFEALKVLPFRLFPLFAPLLFLFMVMRAYRDRAAGLRVWTAVVGLVALMGLGDPLGSFRDQLRGNRDTDAAYPDLRMAFRWMAGHTPDTAVAILPPWPRWSFYEARRAQIANGPAIRLDRVAEWRARLEAMVGPVSASNASEGSSDSLEARYARLTVPQIDAIRARYGGDYLVSRTGYDFPVLFERGGWRVYALGADSAARPGPSGGGAPQPGR